MVAVRRMDYAGGMNSSSRLTVLVFLLTASLVALATTGCQTSKGFGKDVEKLGDKIQEKSS
jgi:predicted small secreted protein